MQCPNPQCQGTLASHLRDCPACGADAGAPNVRLALRRDEVVELELRYSRAGIAANDEGYKPDFETLTEVALKADAVVSMPIPRLMDLLDERSLYSTFGLQLEGGARVPQDNRFDQIRASVEEAFFPNFSRQIRFGSLSARDIGHASYGPCSVILKKSSIENRASLFEFPLVSFADSTGQKLGGSIPVGHRAAWASREKLAATKLGKSCRGLSEGGMADILLPIPVDTLSDCIEVHIFGGFSAHSIARVAIFDQTDPVEKALQFALEKKLEQLNISTRVV